MINHLKELFKDKVIRYNRLDILVNILKTDKELIIPGIYPKIWFSLNDKRYSALVYSKLKLKYNYYDCGKIKILRLNDTKYDQI